MEHPKTSLKLSKNIKKAERVSQGGGAEKKSTSPLI